MTPPPPTLRMHKHLWYFTKHWITSITLNTQSYSSTEERNTKIRSNGIQTKTCPIAASVSVTQFSLKGLSHFISVLLNIVKKEQIEPQDLYTFFKKNQVLTLRKTQYSCIFLSFTMLNIHSALFTDDLHSCETRMLFLDFFFFFCKKCLFIPEIKNSF